MEWEGVPERGSREGKGTTAERSFKGRNAEKVRLGGTEIAGGAIRRE